MSRAESNAPIERIAKILDEYQALEDYVAEIETLCSAYPELFETLPPRPSKDNVLSERVRQSLTLESNRRKRERARAIASIGRELASRTDTENEL